jgi:Ni,Fe-hydrogenase I large subunit
VQDSQTGEGVAAEAMRGADDEMLAELIFRSFDVCSVCTVQ